MSKSPYILIGLIVVSTFAAAVAEAQVYGYTDENGILILSNVPTDDKMRLIADGTAEEAGKTWRYSGQYEAMIMKASRLFGVDSALVRAVIAVESAFNRYARSHKGARGLMQLMPATGRRYGVVNAYDPWQNIRGGTAHLKELIDEFDDLNLVLAAYNAGATPVRRYNGIPPYKETRNYVRRVMAIYRAGSRIQIVKGGKTYSIGQPGGKTRVTQFHGGTPTANPGAAPSTLAELARRNRQRSATFQSPQTAAQVPQQQQDTGRLVYLSLRRSRGGPAHHAHTTHHLSLRRSGPIIRASFRAREPANSSRFGIVLIGSVGSQRQVERITKSLWPTNRRRPSTKGSFLFI